MHRFGVDSLPQSTQIERIDADFDQPTVSAAVPDAVLDEKPAETEAMAGVEAVISETAAAAADFATADGDAGSSAEEQLVDSTAGTWSALEPVPGPEPALQADQELPTAEDSRFSRFTALLKDCLDDVGRVVDREDSPSSAGAGPSSAPPAAASPRPVPASGPRRLRRWLAPVDADDLPKAS